MSKTSKTVLDDHRVDDIWADRFVQLDTLGEGAFGVTYKVHPKARPEDIWALKAVSKKPTPELRLPRSRLAAMFDAEVEVMRAVTGHPGVVNLQDCWEDDYCFYLQMEFLTGGPLFNRIVELDHYSELVAAEMARQMLTALQHIHSRGYAHLDLKPENFILAAPKADKSVKVIDFGLAMKLDPARTDYDAAGTGAYRAPEMLDITGGLRTAETLPKCDIFSFGVVLHIMLTGAMPDFEFKKLILPESAKLSESVSDLLRKLLAWDASDRPTATEALSHAWVKGSAAPDTPLDPSVKKSFKAFLLTSSFQRAMVGILAGRMSEADKAEMSQTFAALDVDGDGKLSVEELKKVFLDNKKLLDPDDDKKAEVRAEKLLMSLDKDHDGSIDIKEFADIQVMKNMAKGRKGAGDTAPRELFKLLDVDGNGALTANELGMFLMDTSPEDLDVMFKEADKNGDGVITADEFIEAMRVRLTSAEGDFSPSKKSTSTLRMFSRTLSKFTLDE